MDWLAIWLSVKLATIVAFTLLVIGLPIAYWLTFSRWRWKFLAEAIVALCDAALRLPQPLGSIGLIGSAAKWTRFAAQLAGAGHGPEAIGRITCPIGQPGITGKDPAVIAVAAAAALLATLGDRAVVEAAAR